jgi:hypothetical protein
MTSKQRVFSHKNELNYNEYTQNKNGIILLKNAKAKCNNINRFLSYKEFITMTKAYYKYKYQKKCGLTAPTNLYNSNTSFIVYQKYIEHISNCDCCNKINIVENECKNLINILYPYGDILEENISNIYYPNPINLECWCQDKSSEKTICNSVWENFDNKIENLYDKSKEKCEGGFLNEELCKTRKKLFV